MKFMHQYSLSRSLQTGLVPPAIELVYANRWFILVCGSNLGIQKNTGSKFESLVLRM